MPVSTKDIKTNSTEGFINVSIGQDLKAEIEKLARDDERSLSQMVRRLLREAVSARKNPTAPALS